MDTQLRFTPINTGFHWTLNTFAHISSLHTLQHTSNKPMPFSLFHLLELILKHILVLSPNLYTYLSVRVLFFASPPSCPLDKGTSQSRRVNSRSPIRPRPPWCVLAPDFGKYIWHPSWGHGTTYHVVFRQLSLVHPWLALDLASDARPFSKTPILIR